MIHQNLIFSKKVKGLIFETRKKTLISSLISFITSSNYTHVEFLLEDKYTYGSKNFKGVGVHSVEDFKNPQVFLFDEDLIKLIYNINFKDLEFELKKFFLKTLGKKYDLKAVLSYFFRKILNNPDNWYCSEFCYQALHEIGIDLIKNVEPDKIITPKDLSRSLFLKRIENNE